LLRYAQIESITQRGQGLFLLGQQSANAQQPAAALSSSESDNIYLWTGCWSDDDIKKRTGYYTLLQESPAGVKPSYPVLCNQ